MSLIHEAQYMTFKGGDHISLISVNAESALHLHDWILPIIYTLVSIS